MEKIARDVSTMGTEALEKHWKSITKEERQKMAGILPELKANASDADAEIQQDDADPETSENVTGSLDDGLPV